MLGKAATSPLRDDDEFSAAKFSLIKVSVVDSGRRMG